MKKVQLIAALALLPFLLSAQSRTEFLTKVLNSLKQIQSASYFTTSEAWAPGDTTASGIFHHYFKEYNNPTDTSIGASFVKLLKQDTTKMTFCYDGIMRAIVYEEGKYVMVDSFKYNQTPFRPLSPPFFNYAKSIIKYAVETTDSIDLDVHDIGDAVYINMTIYGATQVEFFGKPFYISNPYSAQEVSRYEMWVRKTNHLPYRIRREMSHDISITTCENVILNKLKLEDFVARDFFPADYSIKVKGKMKLLDVKNDLVGKVAPDWILNDVDHKRVALKQLKSKVLMIQFTSVSCGPCRASIPFLKKLASEYNNKDFNFVSIESWNKNSIVLKRYQTRNDFAYDFLTSTPAVTTSYQVQAVPVFYILDQDRVIRKVINGYGKETTDAEIRKAIDELL